MDLVRAAALLHPDEARPGHEVSISQLFALHELDKGSPLSQTDLARRLRLEKSSVSRMAAELERKGLLVRERDPDDRRLYRLRLTERGHTVHKEMGAGFHERYTDWFSAMTRAERDALRSALPALARVIREHLD
jgi:DNA-binding MarR family transcriptional regulator